MMGTSVVRFTNTDFNTPTWGVLNGDTVQALSLDLASHTELMAIYFNDRKTFDAAIESSTINKADITLHAPMTRKIQLFAQGLNYADHRAESGVEINPEEEENLMFSKSPSSICGPNDDIIRPEGCELLDYEIELGIVLKKDIHQPTEITDNTIGEYIGGLILCNDVSARDIMFGAPMLQWYKGKSYRTFCPAGPVLYLMDNEDISQLYSLDLTLKMNGKIKQQASTDLFIHRPPKTLSDLSQYTNIDAGDCILTGTPGGVLAGSSLKVALAVLLNFKKDKKRREKFTAAQQSRETFLQPGDFLELEIKSSDGSINLGSQRNMIVDA